MNTTVLLRSSARSSTALLRRQVAMTTAKRTGQQQQQALFFSTQQQQQQPALTLEWIWNQVKVPKGFENFFPKGGMPKKTPKKDGAAKDKKADAGTSKEKLEKEESSSSSSNKDKRKKSGGFGGNNSNSGGAGAGAGAGEAVVEFAADEAAVEATTKNVEPVVEENAFSTPVAAAAEADAAPVVAAEEIPTPAAEEMVMVEKPEDFSGEEWVSVPPPLAPQPSKDEWGDMTVKHMNFDAAAAATVAAVEEPPPPTTPPLTVDFTFALVTLSAQPDVTKYLRAAAFIVGDESVVGPAQLKLAMQPQSNTVNQQRPGVYNHLVTASLALKQQRGASIESRQQHVLGLLKTAVQDGSFLAVASATP
mmetsp:Transcript_24896/g.41242  ORF Transcript_24896/g.41242 Transcript_24896/m.41242 type:complete len:363 (+) Transcript_24896:106-1194(+)